MSRDGQAGIEGPTAEEIHEANIEDIERDHPGCGSYLVEGVPELRCSKTAGHDGHHSPTLGIRWETGEEWKLRKPIGCIGEEDAEKLRRGMDVQTVIFTQKMGARSVAIYLDPPAEKVNSDLLEALKDAVKLGRIVYHERNKSNGPYCDRVDRINAVIAKAEGRKE